MPIDLKESRTLKILSKIDFNMKKNYKFKRKMDKLKAVIYNPPHEIKVWDHLIRNGLRDVHVRIFQPPHANENETILFFHGGGWVTGDIDSYRPVCMNLAEHTNHNVIAVDYRLSPEHKFPAAVEDCYFVTECLYNNYFEGLVPNKGILVGDSAGGNIAAVVSLMARDKKAFMPESQILIYPSTYNDHTEESPFESIRENGTQYLLTAKMIQDYISLYQSSDEDLLNPYFAPLFSYDFSNQPNTLLISAELCPLRDEGEFYGKKLKEARNYTEIHRIQNSLHGFFSMPYAYEKVKLTYNIINNFLKR